MNSLEDRIKAAGGPTSGFDYLRISLAIAVLAWHTFPLTMGEAATAQFMAGWFGAVVRLVLPMFFALSGFLVAGSFEKNTLSTFLAFRVLRIVPALAVEITLSALILGPLLTSFALPDYFSDGKLWRYFLNVVGWIHYQLPGMFLTNPYPDVVNGSLWTVPYELECYAALVVLALLGAMKKPRILFALIMVGAVVLLTMSSLRQGSSLVMANTAVSGRTLILCFLAGMMFNAASSFVPYSGRLCVAALIASLVMLSFPALYVFSPIPAAYATVWLGLQAPPKAKVIFSGDYSYGIYLYAFPIQQMTVQLLPDAGYVKTLLIALIGTSLFAAFSWTFIEKPTLRLKRLFPIKPALVRKWFHDRFPYPTQEEFDDRQW